MNTKEYQKDYRRKNMVNKFLRLCRDKCPECGEKGRVSARFNFNKKTGKKTLGNFQVTHWKYSERKKKYWKTCNLTPKQSKKYKIKLRE